MNISLFFIKKSVTTLLIIFMFAINTNGQTNEVTMYISQDSTQYGWNTEIRYSDLNLDNKSTDIFLSYLYDTVQSASASISDIKSVKQLCIDELVSDKNLYHINWNNNKLLKIDLYIFADGTIKIARLTTKRSITQDIPLPHLMAKIERINGLRLSPSTKDKQRYIVYTLPMRKIFEETTNIK